MQLPNSCNTKNPVSLKEDWKYLSVKKYTTLCSFNITYMYTNVPEQQKKN
jgi:hypothetical protein